MSLAFLLKSALKGDLADATSDAYAVVFTRGRAERWYYLYGVERTDLNYKDVVSDLERAAESLKERMERGAGRGA